MTKMKLDYEKVKQLLEDKPNITQEEYNERFWNLWEETEEEIERCLSKNRHLTGPMSTWMA